MKKYSLLLSTAILAVFMILQSCTKPANGEVGPQGLTGPQGAAGPAGPAGSQGPAGQNGNANVIQITYGPKTHSGSEINYSLTGVTQSTLTNSAYFTYVNPGNGLWYSLPGTTSGGTREYRTYVSAAATSTPLLYISRSTGTGTETFTATRIVIIPASDLRNGRKAAIDYSDYEAVKAYYNLPD